MTLKRPEVRILSGPHLRILERLGGGAFSAAEGKDLCEALFELAKKLPEKKENKVAEKRKNLKKGNCP